MTPSVSVIIPTYNRRAYVQEAIESVLAQTYTDYEIIVIDDGSTDGTAEALREQYGDRIRYEWQENQGVSAARNHGIELACGKYIAFLDSDDLWCPEKLEKQIAYLERHPSTGMVFSEAWVIDSKGTLVSTSKLNEAISAESLSLESLCYENHINVPSSVVVDKGIIETAGGFDHSMSQGEDYDLFLRARVHTSVGIVREPLTAYRVHSEGASNPSSQVAERRLRAHLLALDKVFAAWPEAPPGLKERAVAWQYAKAALMEAALGNEEQTRVCLGQAVAHDDWFLRDPERFAANIVNHVVPLAGSTYDTGALVGLRLVRSVLYGLVQKGSGKKAVVRRIWASVYETLGFAAHRRGDRAMVRFCFSRALVLRPTLVRNRGILSLLVEAVLGNKVASLMRESLHLLAGRSV